MFEGLLARLAAGAIFGKAKAVATKGAGLLSSIPGPVWEGITVVGYLLALFFLHQHYANAALKAAGAAGYERRAAEDAKVIIELQSRAKVAEASGKAISQTTRSTNDAANSAIDADANSLLSHGPGAAGCRHVSNPAIPAASGEHGARGDQPADAAASAVPPADGAPDSAQLPNGDEFAAVPWPWLVNSARQADLDRAEVIAWRDWYVRQSAEWAKLKPEGNR